MLLSKSERLWSNSCGETWKEAEEFLRSEPSWAASSSSSSTSTPRIVFSHVAWGDVAVAQFTSDAWVRLWACTDGRSAIKKWKQGEERRQRAHWNWSEDGRPLSRSAPPSFGAKEMKQKNKLSHRAVQHSAAASTRQRPPVNLYVLVHLKVQCVNWKQWHISFRLNNSNVLFLCAKLLKCKCKARPLLYIKEN